MESDDEKTSRGKDQEVPREAPKKPEKSVEPVKSSGDTVIDNSEKSAVIKRSSSLVQLLHRPPRLGLSRLQRKLNILHKVETREKEE